ncbi:MAG: pyrroline-5-carboxylate reductase [Pseudomonadota bacterium]
MTDKKILFIGCGKMGSAMIKNLLNNGFEYPQLTILKPSKKNQIVGIKYVSSYEQLPKNYQADIVVLAFKPQAAKEILYEFAKGNMGHKIINSKTIIVSILTGKQTKFFEEILGEKTKVIRLMPNMPTLINQGIFGYYANSNIKKSELKSLSNFLNAIGQNIAVDEENLIDSVTAVSGSGPAYLFLFIKLMIEAGIDLGLDKKSAEKLVKQTIYGSAKMALHSNEDLETLIESVTSKGGTTQAALDVLHKNNQFKKIIFDTVKAANKKSLDLSK